MRKFSIFLLSALLPVLLAGSALANARFDSFEASADCEGWQVDGAAKIGQLHRPGLNIEYTVTLVQGGEVLEEQSGLVYVRALMDPDPFSVTGSFEAVPNGNVEVRGFFYLPFTTTGDSIKTFDIALNCGEEVAPRRPVFWKRHPEAWPVQELEIGGVTYSRDEAIQMMTSHFRHRVVKRLFRHTVAAKLNLANGVAGDIDGLLGEADDFLATHDFHSRLPRSERRLARSLKNQLREFNRGNEDKAFTADDGFDDFADETGWNNMKAMYR